MGRVYGVKHDTGEPLDDEGWTWTKINKNILEEKYIYHDMKI